LPCGSIVSRELLERDELLQRIAGRIKKIIRYHLFDVMVWNAAAETK